MSDLLKKPFGKRGKVHQITPESAGWRYVGFSLYHLNAGDKAAEATGDREVILVLVEGKAAITGAGQDWGVLGDRMNVFEKTPPHCLYLPNGDKGLLRDINPSKLTHLFLTRFLFIQKFALSRGISAVTFGRNVFAQCRKRFARDHFTTNCSLYRYFEHMARDEVFQLLAHGPPTGFSAVTMHHNRQRIDGLVIHQN